MPSRNGSNGKANGARTPDGKFGKGNKFGQGNPHAIRVNKFRSVLVEAISPEDLEEVIAAMLAQAKAGDALAAKEILNRTIGKEPITHYIAEVRAGVGEPLERPGWLREKACNSDP